VLLDRERCVSCARCTRTSEQIAGDPFIELIERGPHQQVGIRGRDQPFDSYFSGNTVQICPVGALTGAPTGSAPARSTWCPRRASASTARPAAPAHRHRRGKVLRRLAGDEPLVNEEWNCDKGRWAFPTRPSPTGSPPRWSATPTASSSRRPGPRRCAARPRRQGRAAAPGPSGGRADRRPADARGRLRLRQVRPGRAGHQRHRLPGPAALATRRPSSSPPAWPAGPDIGAVTYADLEAAPAVLLAGFEPEDESPIVFLRLRKAVRARRGRVFSSPPLATRGLTKLGGTLLPAAPHTEPER
jgi:NADH-quinone oxidoreductase subunit G